MKKSFFAFIAAFAVAATFMCAQAYAWTAPVPIASDQTQVGSAWGTKTDATTFKFFKLPADPTGPNFKGPVPINLPDGSTVMVDDPVGVPGLLPDTPVTHDRLAEMVEKMIVETFPAGDLTVGGTTFPHITAMDPTHGFCPAPWDFAWSGVNYEMVMECNVLNAVGSIPLTNQSGRQLQAGYIRNTLSSSEFTSVVGEPPLLENVIGSSQQSVGPYAVNTFPATLKNANEKRDFTWFSKASGSLAPLDSSFTNIYAYDVVEAPDKWLVMPSYDPVTVEKDIQLSFRTATASGGSKILPVSNLFLYNFLSMHISPLIFFKMDDASHKVKQGGYSSWYFAPLLKGGSLTNFVFKFLLSMNMNPIAIEKIHVPKITAPTLTTAAAVSRTVMDEFDAIAVVNQAVIGSIDDCIRVTPAMGRAYPATLANSVGDCIKDPSGLTHKWREFTGFASGGSVTPLPSSGAAGDLYYPHSTASYVTFWQKTKDTTSKNPNVIYQPVAASLVGPGMFHSAVVKDTIGTQQVESVVVASGEKAPDGNYYIYKINPLSTKMLSIKMPGSSALSLPLAAAEPYKIVPPVAELAPYGIESADMDGDGCSEVVVTFRGAKPVAKTPWTGNYGEYVYFKGPSDMMFSDQFAILKGKLSADSSKCIFDETPKYLSADLGATVKRQIAAVKIADVTGDGKLDIVAGDLIVRKVESGPDAGKFAARALVFTDPLGLMVQEDSIRVGFHATSEEPTGPGYLIDIVKGDMNKLAGVSSIDVDSNGNIGVVNGMPLALPDIDCPGDAKTVSAIETYTAIWYFKGDGDRTAGLDPTSTYFAPPRCVDTPESKLEMPRTDRFTENPRGDGGSSDGGGTDFGYKIDPVYDSRAPYIASMNVLNLAQAENNTNNTQQFSGFLTVEQKKSAIDLFTGIGYSSEEIDSILKTLDSLNPSSIDASLWDFILDMISPNVEQNEETGKTSFLYRILDKLGDTGLVSDAYAATKTIRSIFPRGQVMPGNREMTVVFPKEPVTTPPCGNGVIDAGEACDPPGTECAAGVLCDATCQCPTCPPCCPPTCTTCEVPDVKSVKYTCHGFQDEASEKYFTNFNMLFREAIKSGGGDPGESDFICELEYGVMTIEYNIPGAAAPGLAASEVLSSSISPDLTGNVAPAALVQLKNSGQKPYDPTLVTELPTKVDMFEKPTILLPGGTTTRGMRAMTLTPDLQASVTVSGAAVVPELSEAVPISADIAKVEVIPGQNKFVLNNAISLQLVGANSTKGAGNVGVGKAIMEARGTLALCSWSARCPESDAFLTGNGFADITQENILKAAREKGSMCQHGVCPPEFFEKFPRWSTPGYVFVQNMVAKSGETPGAPDITPTGMAFTPSGWGQGSGGCGCNVTALPPSAASFIAMIFAASAMTTGYIALRKRARKK